MVKSFEDVDCSL